MMATGDDDNNVNGDTAMGSEVNDDGNGATSDDNLDDNNCDDDDDDDGGGGGVMGKDVTGYDDMKMAMGNDDDDNDGNGATGDELTIMVMA